MKRLVLLGASGSIGRSALQLIDSFSDELSLLGISVHTNKDFGLNVLNSYLDCKWLVVSGEQGTKLETAKGKVIAYGRNYILEMIDTLKPDMVLFALPGGDVFDIFWAILERKIPIAMANKECLVMSAPIISPAVSRHSILPIDSEQVGLWQILPDDLSMLRTAILTCSGGPFLGKKRDELACVDLNSALNHPRWNMGAKVSLDSATLMNKALEIIEAIALFGLDKDSVRAIIHPQSEVHAIAELVDGNIILSASITDMRVAIQYALSFPTRWFNYKLQFSDLINKDLSWQFMQPDEETFTSLKTVKLVIAKWGSTLTVFNVANDILGSLFMEGKISFLDIMDINYKLVSMHKPWPVNSYESIKEAIYWTKSHLSNYLKSIN